MKNHQHNSQRGMTLIELMVALTVGLFLTLAVTSIIVVTLRQQKLTASVNERDQSATSAIAQVDKLIRGTGSGFSNAWNIGFFGCHIRASKSNNALIPSTPAAPFNNVSSLKNPVAAPLVVEKGIGGNASDVIFLMSGNGATADVPRFITSLNNTSLSFDTAIGYKNNDLLLVAADGISDCYLTQISNTTPPGTTTPPPVIDAVTLGGSYYTAKQNGASASLADIVSTNGGYATMVGNSAASHPTLMLLGINGSGNIGTLHQYDLLQLKATAPQALANGISHLFALYGVDTNNDGKVDDWVDPGSAGWTAAAVMASKQKLRQILAVRIALISYSEGVKQANSSPSEIYAFSSLGETLKRTVTLNNDQRNRRYRVTESIIPLRNNLLIEP